MHYQFSIFTYDRMYFFVVMASLSGLFDFNLTNGQLLDYNHVPIDVSEIENVWHFRKILLVKLFPIVSPSSDGPGVQTKVC